MTEPVQIALIATVAPTVLALAGIVVAVINSRTANRKLDHVTVLTNSTMTAANDRIEELEAQVETLLATKKADLSTLAVEPNDKGH